MRNKVVLPFIFAKEEDLDAMESLGMELEVESIEMDVVLYAIDALIPQIVTLDGEEEEYCRVVAGGFDGMCPMSVGEVEQIMTDAGY